MKNVKSFALIVNFVLLTASRLIGQGDFWEFSRPGIELSQNFGIRQRDNFEFGVNYFFTDYYCKRDTCSWFLRTFGEFQLGSSLTFNPVKVDDGRIWRTSFGMTYTQYAPFCGVYGLSFRPKVITVLNGDKRLFDNIGLKCEIGLSAFSLINVYYGYTFPIRDYAPYPFQAHSICININLNMSFWAFGLGGM